MDDEERMIPFDPAKLLPISREIEQGALPDLPNPKRARQASAMFHRRGQTPVEKAPIDDDGDGTIQGEGEPQGDSTADDL